MKILADRKIPHLDELFGPFATIERIDAAQIQPGRLGEAQILLVRSLTQVNEKLLEGSSVGIVGSATIGTDHVDLGALERLGIPFFNSPGCNADAVSDWVFSMLSLHQAKNSLDLSNKTLGIVGAGNTGGRLAKKALRLGFQVLLCDPPRAEAEPDFPHVPLEELLCRSEILSVHLPLTRFGRHKTQGLIDERGLGLLPNGAILLNSSRGEVIDEESLIRQSHRFGAIFLDVFQKEPYPNPKTVKRTEVATCHIAGYSKKGKFTASEMLLEQIAAHLGWNLENLNLAPPWKPFVRVEYPGSIAALFEELFGYQALSNELKRKLGKDKEAFLNLRHQYPLRSEFSEVELIGEIPAKERSYLEALGFLIE